MNLSRRALAAAPLLATPAPAYPAGTVACDALIVHLAAEWRDRRAEEEALYDSVADVQADSPADRAGMAALDRVYARIKALEVQVADMPARTLSAIQAKAHMARHQFYLVVGERSDSPGERLVYGLLDDILALA